MFLHQLDCLQIDKYGATAPLGERPTKAAERGATEQITRATIGGKASQSRQPSAQATSWY
jgi:hypothetical protein